MRFVASLSCLVVAMAFGPVGSVRAADDPVVHVETDETVNAARVSASIDIAAPPRVVWNVITDCARSPQFIAKLESCRILDRDPAGRWDIREHIINWALLMPKLRTVVRHSYEIGHRLTFKRVEGDMRISEGEWRVEPMANARTTRLFYKALVAPGFPVPDFLIEHTINTDLPDILRAIQTASLADAGKH